MRLSDLQNKDVVDIKTGERLGIIIDAEINTEGNIKKIFVYNKKGLIGRLNSEEKIIMWQQVKKIGFDVILVSIND